MDVGRKGRPTSGRALCGSRGALRGRGFDVVVEQDPLLAGSVLYNLFAIGRSAYGTAAAGPRPGPLQTRAGLQKAALLRQRREKEPT